MHAGASEITYGAPRRNTTAPIEGFSQRAKNRGRARSQCRATARETHSTVYLFSPRSRVVRLHTGATGIVFRAISPRPTDTRRIILTLPCEIDQDPTRGRG